MTATLERVETRESTTTPDERRRRRRAVVLGLLFLGVGTAVTLASWTSDEKATGSFAATSFGVQGAASEGDFAAHSAAAATLTFQTNPTTLSPGDKVYAPYYVRLGAGTTSPGSVKLTRVDADGANAANLTYSLVTLTNETTPCGDSGLDGATMLSNGPAATGVVTGARAVNLTVGSPTSQPGAAQKLCFVVTAGAGLTQGGAATVTWTLTATSSS